MNLPNLLQINRELLYNHHRLSHQQIDDFLGEKSSNLLLPEKMELMEQVREFLLITDILTTGQISFIPLKGPLLSLRIYGDAACRRSKDFDLLIEFNSLEKAIVLLKDLGFKPQFYEWPTDNNLQQFKQKLRNQFHLVHPQKKLYIELHWKLFHFLPVKPAIMETLVHANLMEVEFAGRKFNVLNAEMDLLYLLIHGSLHTWRRLKWLVDVHEIAKWKLYNEEKFVALVQLVSAKKLVAVCNGLLHVIYPANNTLPNIGKANSFMVSHCFKRIKKDSEAEYDSLWEAVSYFAFVMKAFPGIKFKIYTLQYLFNSTLDAGDKKRSVLSMCWSILNPKKFIKTRYHVE